MQGFPEDHTKAMSSKQQRMKAIARSSPTQVPTPVFSSFNSSIMSCCIYKVQVIRLHTCFCSLEPIFFQDGRRV